MLPSASGGSHPHLAPRTSHAFCPHKPHPSPCWCYRPKANIPQSSSHTNPFGDSPTRIYSVVCVFTNHIHPVFCVLTNHILSRLTVNSPSRITQKPQFTKQPLMVNNTNKGDGQFIGNTKNHEISISPILLVGEWNYN